jgi:hypothetical protein
MKLFTKIRKCLKEFGETLLEEEDEDQLSSTKGERESYKQAWETFKEESSVAKELREQLEFIEELKKIPVEKPVETFERNIPKNLTKFPHYFAKVPNFTHLDIYMVSEMFGLNSYQHHAVKKLVATGKRGTKDQVKDLQEAIATIEAWIEAIKSEKV